MNSETRVALRSVAAALVCAVALNSCGGLSDVGEQENKIPTAVAEVVGYAGADANGDVTTSVRAQSEVLLTGNNSVELDKPIVGFLWEPTNTAANAAKLTVRNNSTVAVSVPVVATVTDMQFRLTVTDSDGDTDTATVTLRVQPVLDADRFLTYLPGAAKLRVVAATAQPSTTGGEFDLGLKARVTYRSRSGSDNTVTYDVGTPIQGIWAASTAPSTDSRQTDARNPLFQFAIPGVDLDAIMRQFQRTLPGSAPQLADPAFTDLAQLSLILTLTPAAGTPSAALYVLDAQGNLVAQQSNSGSGTPVELTLTPTQVEDLRITGGGLENRQTATSYYDAIDPQRSKLTLRDWLRANCFDPSASNYGADAHAVYVNNYDLGFGRDMYFRTTRPASCTSPSFNAGDTASVVINYATLEAAAKKVAPIIAVAMEYRADPNRTAPGLVTFYAFAPDEGTGEFRRVSSANFDGRGEKYIPGACTACHGGRPKTPDPTDRLRTYSSATTAGADVGATFMPFDLESFLYSDTDVAFPNDASNAALRAQLTRAQQEAEFKKLNVAAHGTYGIGSGAQFQCHAQFGGPCSLVEMWYGGAGLPSASFRDGQVAPGWAAGGANPSTAPDLYLNVFARNCRACHTQRVFAAAPGSDPQFLTYGEFVQASDPAWRAKVIEQVFNVGGMPAARLSMDRLWQPGANGSPSAGQLLAEHLGLAADSRPGAPTACFSPLSSTSTPDFSESPATRQVIARRDPVTLLPQAAAFSAECSTFGRTFAWELVRPSNSATTLTARNGLSTSFIPDRPGDYDLVLNVTSASGATTVLRKYAQVTNFFPTAPSPTVPVDLNVPTPVNVLGSPGDLPTTVRIDSISGAGLAATLDDQQRIVVTSTGLVGGSIGYTLIDVDNTAADVSSGVITVTVSATLTANTPTVRPRVQPNIAEQDIDLTGLVNAQGQAVTFRISSLPRTSLVGTDLHLTPPQVNRGDATVAACPDDATRVCALYTPPARTITHFGTTAVRSVDSFQYEVCFRDSPAVCDTATVEVEIGGNHSFTPVANTITSPVGTCLEACHEAPQDGSSWSFTPPTPPTPVDEKAVYCAIRFRIGSTGAANNRYPADENRRLVNPGNPTNSLLYVKPNNSETHFGGNRGIDRDPILRWIEEGGSYTGGPDQTCP